MTESTKNICDIKLPGYTLEKRIGAGGYGEVWLANAPGGLTKAVKFIFGFHNEKRAASELRSLEKIKAVRHPFLLSLERIEVIEGRLVIVTELADGSLKDRYENCVQENQGAGIPREELLGYLRDSADALDYLSVHHSLQHLDVKPENLLLLAGHVKVADFGLVKEIQETQASLVGGLTPLYSAPEVFQGQPTIFSDQYSLAVLYQEMLTGKAPFSGATSAELTLQHMHDEPDLSPLPMEDRYLVARALSKDPQQRYASCDEFVQALLNVGKPKEKGKSDWVSRPVVQSPTPKRASVAGIASQPRAMTQVFDDELNVDLAEISKSMLIDLPPAEDVEQNHLASMDLEANDFRPTPTLVIGIGGTAGHVLSQFRKRLSNQFGSKSNVPAVQLLLLDTDKKSLLETTLTDTDTGIAAEETLALQLRRPQDYRDSSKRLLGWMSRRWLYNIPKSLRTEGLRPLGRLAFADHARRTIQRIRLSLSQATEVGSIAQSSEQTGLQFDDQAVRVYVVASISGGTGSGMSIDMGYAVKSLLEKLGIENATTTGVFLHSTGRDSRYCDLAKVNAFSWFKEFNHFSRPEGYYPGDEGSGLPAMPPGTLPFDNTYFLPLGNGLTLEQLQDRSDQVSQYLMLDTLSAAQTFFAASRDASPENTSGSPLLRSIGIHEKKAASQQVLDAVAQQVCHRVVLSWSGAAAETTSPDTVFNDCSSSDRESSSASETNQIICGAPQAVSQLQLNLEGISANARSILESQFGNHVESLLVKMVAESELQEQGSASGELLKRVDTLFAPAASTGTDPSNGNYVSGRRLEAIVSPLGMKLATDLQGWLLHRLDERQERLAGTRLAAEWFVDHFQRVEIEAQRIAHAIGKQLVAMSQENAESEGSLTKTNPSSELKLELVVKYFRLRLDLRALQATEHLVRLLQSELKNVDEAIVEFGRHLRHLADKLALDSQVEDQQQVFNFDLVAQDPIGKMLLANLGELTVKVDQEVQEQFINQQGGLLQAVMGNSKVMADLLNTLLTLAKQQVSTVSRERSLSSDQPWDQASLSQYASQARSPLLDLGGTANQLVVLPQKETREDLATTVRKTLGSETSLLAGADGNLVVCSEVGQLLLARVAIDLIECRRDYADFADRVHTRNDIIWAPLIDAKNPVATNDSAFVTQVL